MDILHMMQDSINELLKRELFLSLFHYSFRLCMKVTLRVNTTMNTIEIKYNWNGKVMQ